MGMRGIAPPRTPAHRRKQPLSKRDGSYRLAADQRQHGPTDRTSSPDPTAVLLSIAASAKRHSKTAELYEQIGRLKVELDWVKKKAATLG
jgi:hypothetical protein